MTISFLTLVLVALISSSLLAEEPRTSVRVGVATVLSGYFADLGQNIVNTIATFTAADSPNANALAIE